MLIRSLLSGMAASPTEMSTHALTRNYSRTELGSAPERTTRVRKIEEKTNTNMCVSERARYDLDVMTTAAQLSNTYKTAVLAC